MTDMQVSETDQHSFVFAFRMFQICIALIYLSHLISFVFTCISIFCHLKLFTQLIKRNVQMQFANGKGLRA